MARLCNTLNQWLIVDNDLFSAPFICLFVVPIVGAWSDRLHSSCGRRKPILLVYSVALVVSMTLLCLAEDLVSEPRTKYHG